LTIPAKILVFVQIVHAEILLTIGVSDVIPGSVWPCTARGIYNAICVVFRRRCRRGVQ